MLNEKKIIYDISEKIDQDIKIKSKSFMVKNQIKSILCAGSYVSQKLGKNQFVKIVMDCYISIKLTLIFTTL